MSALDDITAERWHINQNMKEVITDGQGGLVVHDEYGLMDYDVIHRIVKVPAMEARILADAKVREAADELANAIDSYVPHKLATVMRLTAAKTAYRTATAGDE